MAYTAYRAIVENATDSGDAKTVAPDPTVSREPIRAPHSREKNDHNDSELVEAERNEDTATADSQTDEGDVLADFAEPFFVDEMVVEGHDGIDPRDAATESLGS